MATDTVLIVAAAALVGAVAVAAVLVLRGQSPRAKRPKGASETSGETPQSVRDGLFVTRRRLGERLGALLGGAGRPPVLEELQEALIGADVGVRASTRLVEAIRQAARRDASPEALRDALRREVAACFPKGSARVAVQPPRVVLVTGVNGVGKTTTVAKLAAAAIGRGERPLLVAADTYRAAAIEQLEAWGQRLGVDVIRHAAGASPAAVAFDGVTAACARGVDVVFVDTAGRLHTRTPLMDELRKVRRVLSQVCSGAPHETLLVLDATTGQNAVRQAAAFVEAVDVTGVVLTKLDGTAKGGIAIAIATELGLPIAFLGTGERAQDLRPFDPDEYAEALLAGT